jgi:hypothetical protein
MKPHEIPIRGADLCLTLAVRALIAVAAVPLPAQSPEALFPTPFLVEHHVVQSEPDGTSSATEAVTDYYGGSWLVSVRPNGSRLVVDFSRREMTEIRPEMSTYASLSFERLAELRRRIHDAHGSAGATDVHGEQSGRGMRGLAAPALAQIVVEEVSEAAEPAITLRAAATAAAPAVVKLRVTAGPDVPGLEVWCDRRVRLSERSRAALAELEKAALGGGAAEGTGAGAMLAAARGHADGAFPVRTLHHASAGMSAATIEDVATRLEPIAALPTELLRVPDGYRRVAHPLEVMVAYEEQEAALARGERSQR